MSSSQKITEILEYILRHATRHELELVGEALRKRMERETTLGMGQIDVNQMQLPLLAPLPQFRKNEFDKVITLGMEIPERAADEDADRTPPIGELVFVLFCFRHNFPRLTYKNQPQKA